MKGREQYVFCSTSELLLWLGALLNEFEGVIADFTLWKPARVISKDDVILTLENLDGKIAFYFERVEIAKSDSEFSVSSENPSLEYMTIFRQLSEDLEMPYWICARILPGTTAFRMVSSFMRQVTKNTRTGLRLIDGEQAYPYKMGRYSDAALALQRGGAKFMWNEDSKYTIRFGLTD